MRMSFGDIFNFAEHTLMFNVLSEGLSETAILSGILGVLLALAIIVVAFLILKRQRAKQLPGTIYVQSDPLSIRFMTHVVFRGVLSH